MLDIGRKYTVGISITANYEKKCKNNHSTVSLKNNKKILVLSCKTESWMQVNWDALPQT